jgi:hypothetical protein
MGYSSVLLAARDSPYWGISALCSLIPSRARHSSCLEEDGAELAEAFGAIDQHGEDLVALADVEGEHHGFPVMGNLEAFGGVVEAGAAELGGDRQREFVVHGDPARNMMKRAYART